MNDIEEHPEALPTMLDVYAYVLAMYDRLHVDGAGVSGEDMRKNRLRVLRMQKQNDGGMCGWEVT